MKILATAVLIALLVPVSLFAQQQKPVLLEPIPGVTDSAVDFPSFLTAAFRLLLSAGAILAVLMLVIGGVQYMVSTVPGVKEEGKERIKNALLGLLLLFGSVLILQTINPELLKFKIFNRQTSTCPSGGCADPRTGASASRQTAQPRFTNTNAPAGGVSGPTPSPNSVPPGGLMAP